MGTDDCLNKIIGFDIDKVLYGASFGVFTSFWNLIDPEPKTLTFLCKEQHILVVGTYEQMLYEVLITSSRGFLSYTTTCLGFVFIDRSTLYVTCVGNGNNHLLIRDNILNGDITPCIFYDRTTFVSIFGFYFQEFFFDNLGTTFFASKDIFQIDNLC